MITADQIVAHLVGDYILQSDWMANEKTRQSFAAAVHATFYSLPFLFLRPSLGAWALIVVTHFIIDRWRLARYLCWVKNWIAPARFTYVDLQLPRQHIWPWLECKNTCGYPPDRPVRMSVWLMIIADNTMHLILNGVALRYF